MNAPDQSARRGAHPSVGAGTRTGVRALCCAGVVAVATGCTTPYEGRYDFYQGWRKAEIKRIELFEKLTPYQVPRCKGAPPRSTEGSMWALVRYRAVSRSREVAVQVMPSDDYKVGDLVYVNVSECARQIQRRVAAIQSLDARPLILP